MGWSLRSWGLSPAPTLPEACRAWWARPCLTPGRLPRAVRSVGAGHAPRAPACSQPGLGQLSAGEAVCHTRMGTLCMYVNMQTPARTVPSTYRSSLRGPASGLRPLSSGLRLPPGSHLGPQYEVSVTPGRAVGLRASSPRMPRVLRRCWLDGGAGEGLGTAGMLRPGPSSPQMAWRQVGAGGRHHPPLMGHHHPGAERASPPVWADVDARARARLKPSRKRAAEGTLLGASGRAGTEGGSVTQEP